MKLHKLILAVGFALSLSILMAASASADEVNCSEYQCTDGNYTIFNCIDEFVNANVIIDIGDCTIYPDGYVNGNIYGYDDSNISVYGTVNGNIEMEGGLYFNSLYGGNIKGNIKVKTMSLEDELRLHLRPGGQFNGNLMEEGPGSVYVTVYNDALFNGNINEKGPGDLSTLVLGTFNGNTKEEDEGECYSYVAPSGIFNGNACE